MTTEIERRFLSAKAAGSVRAGLNADGAGIAGTAAVCNSLSEDLGGFREQVKVGSFDKALKTSDVRGLWNHNADKILARVKSGTMTVWADSKGLHFDIPNLPKSRADVLEAVQRRDVTGCSYSFSVAPNGDSWENKADGSRIRTIHEIAAIYDCGPVTFPAFADTVVSVRALQLATETAKVRPPRDSAIEAGRRRLDAAEREGDAAEAAIEAYEDRARVARESRAREERRDRNFRVLFAIADDDWQMREIARLARHEAAHCVLFYFDGAGIEACGLVLAENPARCTGGYARPRDGEMWSAQSILAGIAADRIGGYDKPQDVPNSDVIKAKRELPVGQRSHADIERQIGLASDHLRKYWPAVTALAREIQLRADLDGEEAETIIARALGAYRAA